MHYPTYYNDRFIWKKEGFPYFRKRNSLVDGKPHFEDIGDISSKKMISRIDLARSQLSKILLLIFLIPKYKQIWIDNMILRNQRDIHIPSIYKHILSIAFFVLIFLGITGIIYWLYPVRQHWTGIFRPAAIELLHLHNPYIIENFFNPPWALLPVIPYALLPIRLGNALWAATTIFCLGFTARKMGANWLITIGFLTLPFTLYNVLQVNVDWLVALGFLLPPRWGLFLLLLKPQIGAFLALFWVIEAWRNGGVKQLAYTFGPVAVTFLISFVIFGVYLTKSRHMVSDDINNPNLWPFSIPVGLILLVISYRSHKSNLSITASPMLTPYIMPYSLPLAIFGLIPDQWMAGAGIVGMWLMMLDSRYAYITSALVDILH